MIETNQQALIHKLLVVDVPVETQITRATQRDAMTRDQTMAIINKQSSREEKLKQADDVVDNTGSLTELHQQLEIFHGKYSGISQCHFP